MKMIRKDYQILLNELISVNFNDEFIGPIEKWKAHLNSYIMDKDSMPHRAFSIFLFNSQNQLLFQRRSAQKKTFPLCWTNTCCSHPNMIQYETSKQISVENIREALHRALRRQLNMDLTQEKFYFVEKILYKAKGQNQVYGEYEVDYIYLSKLKQKSVPFNINEDQICQIKWVAKNSLNSFIESKQKENCQLSPWFMAMLNNGYLQKWWNMVIKNQLNNEGFEENSKVIAL